MQFENNINRLNEIINLLQNDEMTLEESLKLYTEGVELSTKCRKELDDVKMKIVEINDEGKTLDE